MEAVEFLKGLHRMCNANNCEKCPIGLLGETIEADCHGVLLDLQ